MNDCVYRLKRCDRCKEELSPKYVIVKNGDKVQYLCPDCAIKVIMQSVEEKPE